MLRLFQNEYYAEKKGPTREGHPIYLHFYQKVRAKDALDTLKIAAHTFADIELVSHRKEIGTNQTSIVNVEEAPKRKRADNVITDEDGFQVIQKKQK